MSVAVAVGRSAALTLSVVDAVDGEPVIAATVCDITGKAFGSTDVDGKIEVGTLADSLVVRHVAYETGYCSLADGGDGIVSLVPRDFQLGEIVVTQGKREEMRVAGFYRCFGSVDAGSRIEESIEEGNLVYYLPLGKNKAEAKPKLLGARTYGRISRKEKRDSLFYSDSPGFLTPAAMMNIELHATPLVERSMFEGVDRSGKVATVEGKYATKGYLRSNGDLTVAQYDALADKKDHVYTPTILKVFGLTTDVKELIYSETYHTISDRSYTIEDIVGSSFSLDMTMRGKLVKKAFDGNEVNARMYIEMYITDISYLSKSEARELRKSEKDIEGVEVVVPAFVPPLDDYALTLKRMVEADRGLQ